MARITATLHAARVFHKDLYLCHFFLDPDRVDRTPDMPRLSLIDLHRLEEHRLWPDWWRWKDLGQLLFSTTASPASPTATVCDSGGFTADASESSRPRWHARMVRLRAARYLEHNRKPR